MKNFTNVATRFTALTNHHELRLSGAFRKIVGYLVALLSLLWLAALPIGASAAVVSFTPSPVGGNQWMYAYSVTVALGEPRVEEFTIFFDSTLYQNLVVSAAPQDWDPLVIQPDSGIPSNGFFDALALIDGISPATSLGGFAVLFDFLGTGSPGAQRFDIVDPTTFVTLQTGFTSAASVVPPTSDVSEPSALALAGLALALLLGFRSRFTSNRSQRAC